ncbi:MAG: HD-GYP domain-containing protein [Planctomycetota bacterium]
MEHLVSAVRLDRGIEWHILDCAPLTYSTATHSVNVGVLLLGFAGHVLGLSEAQLLWQVAIGGVLHDLGKALVPREILTKPAGLTRSEFAQIKKHPWHGLNIARPHLRRAPLAQCIIGQHHESVSGDGYPEGRSGESINAFARAARVVDVFDALTSHRPYGPALDGFPALNTMVTEMRGQFDMAMLRKFIRFMGKQSERMAPVAVAEPKEESHAAQPAPPQPAAPQVTEPEPPPQPAEVRTVQPDQATVILEPEAPDPVQPGPGPAEADAAEPMENEQETTDAFKTPAAEAVETTLAPGTVIHLEPVLSEAQAEQEPRQPSVADAESDVELDPDVQEKLDAIRALVEEQTENTELMGGIMSALKAAFGGPLGSRLYEESALALEQQAEAVRQREVEVLRGLFPLVWQLDEWRGKFLPSPHQNAETAAACADALRCVEALRGAIVELLGEHHIEVIEEAEQLDPGLHRTVGGLVSSIDTAGPARVRRVGFLYKDARIYEVLEPARVVIRPDLPGLRRAG